MFWRGRTAMMATTALPRLAMTTAAMETVAGPMLPWASTGVVAGCSTWSPLLCPPLVH